MQRWAVLLGVVLIGAGCGRSDTTQPTSLPTLPTTSTSISTSSTSTPPPTTGPPGSTTTTTLAQLQGVAVEPVADGFDQAVWAGLDPGTGDLLVVERRGRILGIDGEVRFDIDARVGSGSSEQGLLGLAFHPDDPDRFYLDYTDTGGDTTISEFRRVDGVLDAGTERVLLRVPQPAANHNGGNLAFGPDGMLYIGMGDGGAANDRFGNGQDPTTLLGSMLRIDPDAPDPLAPSGNPFVASTVDGASAVWAYGLRNPWRFTFDGELLYVADVGQNSIEEVSVVRVGDVGPGRPLNFGWPILEGSDCFGGGGCDRSGLVEPVVEYSHADGCSITGGIVLHDPAIPELDGFYIYGDYCGGFVRGFLYRDGAADGEAELLTGLGSISSFGVDADGGALVVTLDGTIGKIVPVR